MSSMRPSAAINHSSHPTTLSWGKMLLAAGGVVATGLLGVQYIRFRSQSSSSSDPSTKDSTSAHASSDLAAQAASADKLMERMQKMVNKLESLDYTSDSDVEVSQSEVDSSSSMASASFGSKSNLSRLLRNARLCASSPTRAREKNIRLQHRLLMARLLLAVHRSGRVRSVTSLASADEEMRADYEKAWKLCEGNQRKAEAEEMDIAHAKPYDPTFPHRQQLDYLLLRVAAELKDAPRMLKSLARLLHIDFDTASSTAVSSSSSSSVSPHLHTPVLIASSVLDSLSRPSLLLAYTIAPLLGCWLWSFQLGQKLFPNRAPAAASCNANTHDEIPLSLTHASASPDETYEEMHTTALTQSKLIDYSVVYELATQRAVKKCLLDAVQNFPTPATADTNVVSAGHAARLQSRLHLSESFLHAPSSLPFDEQGRLLYGNPSAASAIITPPPSVTSSINSAFSQPMSPTSSSVAGGDQLVVAPSPLFEVLPHNVNQNVNWEEWEIRAYTTSVESVDTPDINLKKQLFSILNSQKDQIHEFPSSSSSPPHMASPNSADASTASDSSPTAAASPNPPSTIPVQGPRQIYREGTLFHSVGLFGQQVPVVGTVLRSPLSSSLNSLHSDSNSLSFFMQGYCHVQGPTIDQDYNQFEYYCFNQPSTHSGVSSPTTHSSNSNIITQSMIEAHALSSEENTAAVSQIHSPVAAHTGATNSALLSPMANSTHLFDSASFASLHMQHFHDPSGGHVSGEHSHQAHSPMLSPVGTPPLSTPSPSPLQRYVTSIPNAEVWTGTYRVIQAPIITDESPIAPSTSVAGQQRAVSTVHSAAERRPFIQVTYSISLAVVQMKNRRGSTETPLPPAVASVAHSSLSATHPSSLASSLQQLEQKE